MSHFGGPRLFLSPLTFDGSRDTGNEAPRTGRVRVPPSTLLDFGLKAHSWVLPGGCVCATIMDVYLGRSRDGCPRPSQAPSGSLSRRLDGAIGGTRPPTEPGPFWHTSRRRCPVSNRAERGGTSVRPKALRPAGTRAYEPFGPSGFGSRSLSCGFARTTHLRNDYRCSSRPVGGREDSPASVYWFHKGPLDIE